MTPDDAATRATPTLRDLAAGDLAEVVRIDAIHTGREKRDWWERVFGRFLGPKAREGRIGLAMEGGDGLAGYLFGEVRAFEFGSEACGWIFALGVEPAFQRAGVATALLAEAGERFRRSGVTRVRTMVRRNDVRFLALFRSNGYRGGPFVQLERDLEEA